MTRTAEDENVEPVGEVVTAPPVEQDDDTPSSGLGEPYTGRRTGGAYQKTRDGKLYRVE